MVAGQQDLESGERRSGACGSMPKMLARPLVSYDLTARSDDTYSTRVVRNRASALVASLPNVHTNGPGSFVLQRGEEVWMEVDLELVTEDGDSLDHASQHPSAEINCVRFHVHAAFQGTLDECIATAIRVATGLGWHLNDEQTGAVVRDRPSKKPWWRFW
jgi:hypothetical protein